MVNKEPINRRETDDWRQTFRQALKTLPAEHLRPTSPCPDSESMVSYVMGTDLPEVHEETNSHIAFCDDCWDDYLALVGRERIAKLIEAAATGKPAVDQAAEFAPDQPSVVDGNPTQPAYTFDSLQQQANEALALAEHEPNQAIIKLLDVYAVLRIDPISREQLETILTLLKKALDLAMAGENERFQELKSRLERTIERNQLLIDKAKSRERDQATKVGSAHELTAQIGRSKHEIAARRRRLDELENQIRSIREKIDS